MKLTEVFAAEIQSGSRVVIKSSTSHVDSHKLLNMCSSLEINFSTKVSSILCLNQLLKT